MRKAYLQALAIVAVALLPSVLTAGRAVADGPAGGPNARIVVLRGGDLYLLDSAGGALTRLTSDQHAGPPAWSPDGGTLFFDDGYPGDSSSARWRWTEAGGLQQAGPSDRVYSDDGTVSEQTKPFGDPGLLVDPQQATYVTATVSGRTATVTPMEPGARWIGEGWSPDDRTLALTRSLMVSPAAPPSETANHSNETLWVTTGDPLSGQLRQLQMPLSFNNTPGLVDTAAWSPNGRYLTVGVGPDIPCNSCRADGIPYYAAPVDGGAPISLGAGFGRPLPYSWAPDASFVVTSGPIGREPTEHKRLLRTDLPSGAQRTLDEQPNAVDVEPAVSPDGRTVAFARGVGGPLVSGSAPQTASLESRRIWLVDANGANPRELTGADTIADDAPAWTPDGRWVIYARRPSGPLELWAVPTAGGEPRKLIDGIGPTNGDTNSAAYYDSLGAFFTVAPAARLAALGTGGPTRNEPIRPFVVAGVGLLAVGATALRSSRGAGGTVRS